MGLFSRKPSYADQAEQKRLDDERLEAERKQYVEEHAGPWIERLAAARNGANRCSPEVFEAAGDPGWPEQSGDVRWFVAGAETLLHHRRNVARIEARYATDEEVARPWHDEVEFWLSVEQQFSDQGIMKGEF